jgi:biopolymer transport protein ExbD
MNFSRGEIEEELSFDINVIPLIDVLLVLLIFFMTSASFIANGGLDVKLPASNNQSKAPPGEQLRIVVLQDGSLQFDGKAISETELVEKLKLSQGKAETIVIRADEKSEHGAVVRAMDAAKSAGFEKVAIATSPKS